MQEQRPYVICISGFDPSGGAGILADVKTMEMHRVQGLGVCTSLTFQHEDHFSRLEWVSEASIIKQLTVLTERYCPIVVKVGLIENLQLLKVITERLKKQFPDVKIVWDPVIKASSGYEFHTKIDNKLLHSILHKVDLITPNLPESEILFGTTIPDEIALKTDCSVLLKGGHSKGDLATDILISKEEQTQFQHEKKKGYSKHGTGCVLSSAIAANLALGKTLPDACSDAKEYIQYIIASNSTRLAYHYE